MQLSMTTAGKMDASRNDERASDAKNDSSDSENRVSRSRADGRRRARRNSVSSDKSKKHRVKAEE